MIESLQTISNKLKESALTSANAHLLKYLEHENEIIELVKDFEGIKSEYYCYDHRDSRSIAKFLAIYSDLTSFFTAPAKTSEYHLHVFTDENPRNIERKVDIPPALLNTSINRGYPMRSSFLYKNDLDTKSIAQQIGPFLENGMFLLRPLRTLIVNIPPGVSNIQYEMFFASADTPDDHWVAKVVNEKDSFTIDNGRLKENAKVLFELTLPFFDKAPSANLVKMLEDESDLILGFRAAFKDLCTRIIKGENVDDIRNDVIRPEIEKINRRFKSITNVHRIGIGSSVAAFSIALIAIQVDAHTNFQSLFNAFFGTSALGFVASEIRYQQEVDKLKDSPYFLLWKISKK